EIGGRPGLPHAIDGHDMRILNRRRGLALPEKPPACRGVLGQVRPQDLDGNGPVQDGVPRLEHLPHAALPQDTEDLVVLQPVARGEEAEGPRWRRARALARRGRGFRQTMGQRTVVRRIGRNKCVRAPSGLDRRTLSELVLLHPGLPAAWALAEVLLELVPGAFREMAGR